MYPMSYTPYQCPVAPPPMMMAPQPVVMAPQPIMMAPPPVVMAPQPIMMAPQPVLMAPPPMVVAPPPMVIAPPPMIIAPPPVMVAQPPVIVSQPMVVCPAVAPSAVMPSINITNTNTNQNQLSSMVGGGGGGGGLFGRQGSGERLGIYSYNHLWSISLFNCNRDWKTCLMVSACYPCYVFYLAHFLKESIFTPMLALVVLPPTCCAPITVLRNRLRNELELDGSLTSDAIVTCLCGPCVMCQMMNQYHYTYDKDTVAADGTVIKVAQADTIKNGDMNHGYRYCVIQ